MSNVTVKTSNNIFYQARCKASMHNERLSSREGAADIMSIDRGRLYRIESGLVNPYPEEVLLMADLYKKPELKCHYCHENCPLGKEVPVIDMFELDRITIKTLATFRKLEKTKEILIEITEDGVITKDEKPELDKILNNFDEMIAVAQSLKVWAERNFG